jgi:hypothetical protein
MPPPPPTSRGARPVYSQPTATVEGAKKGLRRPAVYAVAFAAVVIVGSLTGAQLKQDKQKEEVCTSIFSQARLPCKCYDLNPGIVYV